MPVYGVTNTEVSVPFHYAYCQECTPILHKCSITMQVLAAAQLSGRGEFFAYTCNIEIVILLTKHQITKTQPITTKALNGK